MWPLLVERRNLEHFLSVHVTWIKNPQVECPTWRTELDRSNRLRQELLFTISSCFERHLVTLGEPLTKLSQHLFMPTLSEPHHLWEFNKRKLVQNGRLKEHDPGWNIVFSWLWPGACFKLTLLSRNWKKPSPKVIEAKKYELNRQNNSQKSQNFIGMVSLISWPPVNKSNLVNCIPLQSLQSCFFYLQTTAFVLLYRIFLSNYSWIPITRTSKGNWKRFELAGVGNKWPEIL